MKKLFNLSLVALSVLGLASCDISTVINETTSTATESETTTSETTTTTTESEGYTGTYYDSITNITDGDSLKTSLNTLINTGFLSQSYSSDSTHLQTIDSYDGDYVECLYTGLRLDKDQIGTQWNKEHIWAKSLGFGDTKYSAYSDLHHLRVTQIAANSNRGNKYFAEVTNGTTSEYGYSYTSTTFEPRDEVKGDVARMILYMTVMYNDSTLDLELTNDTSLITTTTGGTAYIGLMDTLLKWNMEDPVDSREIARNDAIYEVQGNRNPFIDHPYYAYYIYQSEYTALGYTEEDALTLESTRTVKDDTAIANTETLIKAIPSSVTDSNVEVFAEALETAEASYDSLDSESKSFVSEYDTLVNAIDMLAAYQSAANQDTTVSTTFALTGLSSNTGTLVENGISIDYEASLAQTKGLYSQTTKSITMSVSNLYSTIQSVTISYKSNKNTPSSVITITDGTNTVSKTVTCSTTENSVTLALSTLDLTKDVTITITNETGNSVIIPQIVFNI